MKPDDIGPLRLRVTAEPDPCALARVLERFHNLNVLPRRITAELDITGMLRIEVDIIYIEERILDLIAAKLGDVPCILNVYWHSL